MAIGRVTAQAPIMSSGGSGSGSSVGSSSSSSSRTSGGGGAGAGLRGLFKAIGAAYDDLIARGREDDAFALREATTKFANAGSKFGVNQFARNEMLSDLKAKMTAASGVVAAKNTAAKLTAQAGILDRIAGLEASEFQQEMQTAKFEENKRSALFREDLATKQFEAQDAMRHKATANAMAGSRDRRMANLRASLGSVNQGSPISRGGPSVQGEDPRVTEARARIIAAEQGLNKRTAGGFLTTGVGRNDINPNDIALAGSTIRGGGGYTDSPRPRMTSPVGGARNPAPILTPNQRFQQRKKSLSARTTARTFTPVSKTPLA